MAIDLRDFTPARVAVGRVGHALPTSETLRFALDHARAVDAVHRELDPASLGFDHRLLRSAARNREEYLLRPDLGRMLSEESREALSSDDYDAALVIADGLSATAVHRHARPLLDELLPLLGSFKLAPITVVLQGRVAIADEIGEALGANMSVILIGERPGLTAPDSLGAYLTWGPRRGLTDAERNCVSNIRPEGLPYTRAAASIALLMEQARARRLSGVGLSANRQVGQG